MLVVAPWGFGAGFPASNHGSIRIRGQQRVRTVERRTAWSTTAWLPLSLALLCAACPSVDATPPAITEVIPLTTIDTPSFDLRVRGRGFGLREVSFDLSKGSGEATALRQRLALRSADGTPPVQVRVITTTVASPSELRATVYLFAPLPAGEYGVVLYVGDDPDPVAESSPAFAVRSALVSTDAGVTPRPDATPLVGPDAADAGAGPADADPPADDGGPLTPPDAGFVGFDAAPPVDSGLGPFPPGPGFRRAIVLSNDTGLPSPVDLTARITVPHGSMLAANQTRADGTDLAVYLGTTQLPHQVEDTAMLGTDRLELIVRLPVAVPAGTSAGLPLALTSDPVLPAATPPTDAVYVFAERFAGVLGSVPTDPNRYNDRWEQSCPDRRTGAANASKCRTDAEAGLTRRTVATPRILAMSNTPAANEVYEVVAYVGGTMQANTDIVYFSYGPDNSSFERTILLPELAYDPGFRPNATLTFQEVNNNNRTVSGWRLPSVDNGYQRMRVSFVPQLNQPNLHFRFISADNQARANTQVRLDDLVVRRALNPDFRVTLGPAEAR